VDTFGKRIRTVRYALGLNQDDVAGLVSTAKENVCRWEKDAFAPKIDVKKIIADSLNLSLDWLVKRSDFPLLPNRITNARPLSRHFDESLPFIREAADRAKSIDVLYKPYEWGSAYYILLFHLEGNDSVVLFYPPLGHEKAFNQFLAVQHKVKLNGETTFPDEQADMRFRTSFEEIVRVFGRILSEKRESFKQERHFFIDLYNVRGEHLIEFLYSTAETFREKFEKYDKMLYAKLVPAKLSPYRRQHEYYKSIVKKLILGNDLTEKEKSIINEFTSAEILKPHKRDWFEALMTFEIKHKKKFDLFSVAYQEVISLMVEEGRKNLPSILRIDEEKDELSWA
jgi:transcriptional regulator with XRE-family HTH domain